MTIQEMNETGFVAGMKCIYKGNVHEIIMVDFEECLLGLNHFGSPCEHEEDIMWVRCENIELVQP